MIDPFHDRQPSQAGPAADALPVTPADGADLPQVAAALYVETGGALSVVTASGATRTIHVGDFSVLPVRVRAVNATGTTAAGVHALVLV